MGAQLKLHLVVVEKDDSRQGMFLNRNCTQVEGQGHAVNIVRNSANWSMARIGNKFLNGHSDYEVFGLCHGDAVFSAQALTIFRDTAAAGFVCGIVGRDLSGNYIWSSNVIRGTVPVSTLDCCSVFFRRDAGLRFDEQTFDGFHCYVEDVCLQAAAKGISVVVPPAKASHLEESSRDQEWLAQYKVYRKRLADKWAGVEFQTT